MPAKIKPLRSSLREKKRYIVFEFVAEHRLTAEQAKKAITDICSKYIGQFGLAKANIKFIKNSYTPNKGIIRVTNKAVDDVRASLSMIDNIEGKKVAYRTLGVSGIIKKAKNKFLIKNQ